jgi:protoporphyrinogen oxidase
MTADDTIVIGAGPAGLAFAHRYGAGAVVLESLDEVGGLSRSIEIGDGVFDIGGHSFHTPHREVRDFVAAVMGGTLAEQPRDARVWFGGELIPYPFQHHFEKLGDQQVVEACRGHRADPASVAAACDFEDWILRRFGPGIAGHFMLPYNRKLWARDLATMSCEWVVERVATDRPTAGDAEKARRPLQSDSRVAYPAKGGFGEIFKAMAAGCGRIEVNETVVRVDADARIVETASGRRYPWRRLVSTMPVPYLLACLDGCDPAVRRLAEDLEAVSLKVLLLLVHVGNRPVPQRVYLADPAVCAHKIAFNHTSSPELARRQNHAIMCEVSYSPLKPAPPDEDLIANVTGWLEDCGYIDGAGAVLETRVMDVPFGYPVYTPARLVAMEAISAYLAERDIRLIGRFGAWVYANSDECMRQGLALADELRAG